MDKQKLGKKGEDIAAGHLVCKGFEIIARNFHAREGEIDIIAKRGIYIVFVEVKLRKNGSPVSGIEAVTPSKMRKLYKTALVWLNENPCDLQPRFDVISVTTDFPGCSGWGIDHIENAFGAEVML